MSLGGLTALGLASEAPELVRKLVLVDVTPGVNRDKASAVISFIAGPESFASFDEILERTVLVQPHPFRLVVAPRDPAQRAERPDGTWAWRYERFDIPDGMEMPDFGGLWEPVDAVTCRCCSCAALTHRSSATKTWPSSPAGVPEARVVVVEAPATACKATARSSSRP